MNRSPRASLVPALLVALSAAAARAVRVEREPDPVAALRSDAHPNDLRRGLLEGGPGHPGWQQAAEPLADDRGLRPLLVLALSRPGRLEPRAVAWLDDLTRGDDPLERRLAEFALRSHGSDSER